MDSFTYHLYIHQSSNSSSSSSWHSSSSSFTNFPIIAFVVIGILATAFLLVSYYIIVIKCCLNLQRVSMSQDSDNISQMMLSPTRLHQQQKCGLEQSVINSIPIIEFKKSETGTFELECSVCLGEFQDNEKLRSLQDCNHLFHMDCIDVWLQNNSNCPLCRTTISQTRTSPYRQDLTTAETTTCVDSNFVVIEIQPQPQQQLQQPEQRDTPKKLKRMKHQQMLSMGDECIDIRSIKDEMFKIQPIRRSMSMDSSNDPQLYSMVQNVLLRHHQMKSSTVTSDHLGCTSSSSIGSSSSRFKRSFFSFGSGRGCKSSSAVLPTHVVLP